MVFCKILDRDLCIELETLITMPVLDVVASEVLAGGSNTLVLSAAWALETCD